MSRCSVRRYSRREPLFVHGDPSDGMHVVRKGRVMVRISTPTGDEASLAVVGPGQSVGEQSLLLEDGKRSASAVALEAAETLFLSRAAFGALREADPTFDRVLLRLLAARVLRLTDQLIEALYVPATTRVIRRVADAASLYGDGTIPLTQEEVASMAGTTRPTVNRVLRAAQESGALDLARGRVKVLDLELLHRMVDGS
ncbi:MAG TPA: Crp/Fnr family transcriptional regulator [Acidimicrobiales bacterium]|nr:Crp/Fnr family transcriptional regulator [Acidimicrobiales bacterium]